MKHKNIVNDIVDMNFATLALYFDGLLTKDRKLVEIYKEVEETLSFLQSSIFDMSKKSFIQANN